MRTIAAVIVFAFVVSCSPKPRASNGAKDSPTSKTAEIPVRLGDRGHYQRNEHKERVILFVHGIYGSAMTTWNCPLGGTSWPELIAADDTFKNWDIYVPPASLR